MSSKVLRFKASTNLKNLLGKDLVTDHITAVYELVKNSYDADARRVILEFRNIKGNGGSLVISDNGSGMDLRDIEEKWMVIGTESKKNKLYSEKYHRPLNGDKGIGRFSVDRLGERLRLKTLKENTNSIVEVNFDWNKFEEKFLNIDEVEIPFNISLTDSSSEVGVTLEISGLRDQWSKENVSKLIRNLRQFKSPFETDEDPFDIIVHAPEFGYDWLNIEASKLGDVSSLWIEAEIPKNDTSEIIVSVTRNGITYKETHKNMFDFGPVKSVVYFFDQKDKISFASKMGTTVKDFGNIRLYRDNFRIYPYGDSLNDWLDLDLRKAQGYSRHVGSRDVVGYVQIYKVHNKGIDAPTNRQGIVNNSHAEQLRGFIIDYPIKILEKYFFKVSKNETFEKSAERVETALVKLRKVTSDIQKVSPENAQVLKEISEVVAKSIKEQEEYVRNQEELMNVYKRIASKEILLHSIIHQALIRIEKVKSVVFQGINTVRKSRIESDVASKLEETFENVSRLSSHAREYLKSARDHLIRKRKNEEVNLQNVIGFVLRSFNDQFSENNISVSTEVPEVLLKIDRNDIITILENFISNSIKSLSKIGDSNRQIIIRVVDSGRFVTLDFIDNGVGIPAHLHDRIFDPFFSTTNSFGMGLSIVNEIVREYNGEMNLGINNEIGAEFQIKFKR